MIFSTFVTFQVESTHTCLNYIPTTLLPNDSWTEASEEPLRASLSLAYTLNKKEFNLKIDDTPICCDVKGVIFYGSFPYRLDNTTDKLKSIKNLLENWREDLKIYQDIVDKKFLGLNQN